MLLHQLTLRDAASQPMILQRKFGWAVRFRLREASYEFLVSFRDPDWVGLLERRRALVDYLLRRPQRSVGMDALVLVDSLLSSAELIFDVRWHYEDDAKTA